MKSAQEEAIRWAPANPAFYARLAQADPGGALPAIRKAAELNPRNAGTWMEYSQIAEDHRDFGQAEACLLQAERIDKTFAPRWLLSEYYFRRRDADRFWPAVKVALATSYDDVSPLFQECWDLAPEPGRILQVMPERADVLRQYLDFVVNEKARLDLALPVAARLGARADPDNTLSLLNFCGRLLDGKQAPEALGIWNSLAARRFVPYPPISPERGPVLTNGSFSQPFVGNSFDWRMPVVDGMFAGAGSSPRSLRFTFSGQQPEQCELLSQWVPLMGERRYRVRVRYSTLGLEGDTGISWQMTDAANGRDLLGGAGRLLAAETGAREFVFATPAKTQLAKLILSYRRVLGTVRISGSLSLYQVSLGFAE